MRALKKIDQYSFILGLLWEAERLETEKLTRSCLERNVVKSEAEMEKLLKHMADKHYITASTGSLLAPLIKPEELPGKSIASMGQTFVNGGSEDKMIYRPPSTPM